MLTVFPISNDINIDDEFRRGQKEGTIFLGSSSSQKTSLLFQSALTISNEGSRVWYICPKKFASLPATVRGMPIVTAKSMELIKFFYFEETKELMKCLSKLHVERTVTNAILIDDFQYYIQQLHCTEEDFEHSLAKLLALLKDSANYMSRKTSINCTLIIAIEEGGDQGIYAHVCRQFMTLWQISQRDDVFSALCYADPRIRVEYCIKDKEIFLHRFLKT